eukprot:sb/3477438/
MLVPDWLITSHVTSSDWLDSMKHVLRPKLSEHWPDPFSFLSKAPENCGQSIGLTGPKYSCFTKLLYYFVSDPNLVHPDLVTPRFRDRINFPRYRKLTLFDPDLLATPI